MYDLIYGGNEFKKEILEVFPNARIGDASDEVHEDRIEIEVEGLSQEEYWEKICMNGFAGMSLNVQMSIRDSDLAKRFKDEMEKWKVKYPDRFSKA